MVRCKFAGDQEVRPPAAMQPVAGRSAEMVAIKPQGRMGPCRVPFLDPRALVLSPRGQSPRPSKPGATWLLSVYAGLALRSTCPPGDHRFLAPTLFTVDFTLPEITFFLFFVKKSTHYYNIKYKKGERTKKHL